MEILNSLVNTNHEIPKTFRELFPDKKFAVLDIETTGVNPKVDKVILIGILYFENEQLIIRQYFANSRTEEKDLLYSFADKFKEFQAYLTFNGHSFDLPFLNKRLMVNNINFKIDTYPNIDLFRIIRKYKDMLGLENCKLKTLEKFLGIERDDEISGKESVELYNIYENTRDTEIRKKILLHNREDILYLFLSAKILDLIDIREVFSMLPREIPICEKHIERIRVIDQKIERDFININGEFIGNIKRDYFYYNGCYSFSLIKKDKIFNLKLPIINIQVQRGNTYSLINIEEIDIFEMKFNNLKAGDKEKFIISEDKNIIYQNLHNVVKEIFYNYIKKAMIL